MEVLMKLLLFLGMRWKHVFYKSVILSKAYKIKMSSFKSNENIHKKENGSYYVVSANKASSMTL